MHLVQAEGWKVVRVPYVSGRHASADLVATYFIPWRVRQIVLAVALIGLVLASQSAEGTLAVQASARLPDRTLHVLLQARNCAAASSETMAAARDVITKRIRALHVSRPQVTEVGICRIDVVAHGVKDQHQFIATISATGELILYGMGKLPVLKAGQAFPYAITNTPANNCDAPKPPSPCIVITGADLDHSKIKVGYDQFGAPVVNAGTKGSSIDRFSQYTGAHVGQNMAIVLDGKVITDPTIQAPLSTDWQITGIGSVTQANTIAISLKYSALPIAFEVIARKATNNNG
jgi:preprotein translocase subunit SecD